MHLRASGGTGIPHENEQMARVSSGQHPEIEIIRSEVILVDRATLQEHIQPGGHDVSVRETSNAEPKHREIKNATKNMRDRGAGGSRHAAEQDCRHSAPDPMLLVIPR